MDQDVHQKLDQLLQGQQELLRLLQAAVPQRPLPAVPELLDSTDIKLLLNISDRGLYRLRKNKKIASQRIGGKWYYAAPQIAKTQ